MAEILGLASSIVAIAGAADAALRMARSMRRLSKDLGAAREDIKHFARDIDNFASIIGAAHYSLQIHSTEPQSHTKVLVFIHERNLLDRLVDQSDHVIDHIKELRPSIKSLRSSISFVERLKWLLHRADVRALGPKMESVKTSLNLVISLVTYEALMQSIRHQANSRDTSLLVFREMKRLKRDMKRLMEQMDDLQERQQNSSLWNLHGLDGRFVNVQMDIQEALFELGESVVRNATVTDEGDSPTSSQTVGTNHHRNAVPVVTEGRQTSPVPSPRHLRHRRLPIPPHKIRQVAEQAPTPAHPDTATHQDTNQQRWGSESEEPKSDAGEGPSANTKEVHPIPRPGPSREGDYVSTHPTTYHLEVASYLSHSLRSMNGYIKTANGLKSATVLLDPKLPQSIMSLAFAKELGLQTQLPEEDQEAFWLKVDNFEERKSSGYIAVEWSQGAILDNIAFTVHCLVFDHDEIKTAIFGAPFLPKSRHYLQTAVAF